MIVGSSGTWSEYLNGTLLSATPALPTGSLGTMSTQQQMLSLGGDFTFAETAGVWPSLHGDVTPTAGNSTGYIGPFNGSMSDVGMYGTALIPGEVKAISTTPAVAGLGTYNLGKMNNLFQVYAGTLALWTDPASGGLTWTPVSGLSSTVGQAWSAGGYDYVQLDASGGGVEALVIPEPGTLALLAAGLAGLLCYAWRKRR